MDLLLHNLRTIGTHHCDQTVGVEAVAEIEWMRAALSALIAQADSNPFCPIGHWVEHGAASEMLRGFRKTRMTQEKIDAQ